MASDSDIAWAAGLFEGEGSISIKVNVVDLRLGMTDRDVVERFREIVGAGVIYRDYRAPSLLARYKPRHQWVCATRPDAERILYAFLPFLGERRTARALEALALIESFYRTCYCGKHFLAKRPGHVYCSRTCKRYARTQIAGLLQ